MKAGVLIDDWKLPIFKKVLSESGLTFATKKWGPGLYILHVETESPEKLKPIVKKANTEAEMVKQDN